MSLISRQPSLQALLSAGNPPLRPLQDKPLIQRPHPQVVLKPAPPQVIPVSKAPVVLEPLKQKQPMDDKDNTAMEMMDLASDQMLQNVVQKVIEESGVAKQLLLKQQKKKEDKIRSILVMKEVGEMILKAFPSDKEGDPGSGLKEGLGKMMEDAVKSLQNGQQVSLPDGGQDSPMGSPRAPSTYSVFSPRTQERARRAVKSARGDLLQTPARPAGTPLSPGAQAIVDAVNKRVEERRRVKLENMSEPSPSFLGLLEEAKGAEEPVVKIEPAKLKWSGKPGEPSYTVPELKSLIKGYNANTKGEKLALGGNKPELYKRLVDRLKEDEEDEDEFEDADTIPEEGEGLFSKTRKKIPVGAHHVIDTTKFGKGILSIARVDKHGARKKVAGFKNRPLSDAYKEALTHVLRTRKQPDLSELTPEERDNYFKVIALSSLPVDGMNTKHIQALQEAKKENSGHQGKANKETKLKALKERLAMLVGQMNSGNDGNPEIIKEVKGILAQLVRWDLMSNAQVATFTKRYVK